MEEFLKNKTFKILLLILTIISIVHVIYATITMRGMYEVNAFYMLEQLNNLSDGTFKISYDFTHPGFFIMSLLELPSLLTSWAIHLHNKFLLMMIYSCSLFILPLLALWWNYNLSKKTQRFDIFYWSLFSYFLITITFSILSFEESILYSVLIFVLWNYLAGKINYNKKEIILITVLLIAMLGTYEHINLIGLIFFIASLMYAKREENLKNKIIKIYIGIGSLSISIINLIYVLISQERSNELIKFLKEGYKVIPHLPELNFSISILTLIILIIFIFRKQKMGIKTIILLSLIYILSFYRLINTLPVSLVPMWEQHLKVISYYALPLIFTAMCLLDFFKKEQNYTKLTNYICIVLLCGIMHTAWQLVNTYYWNNNIQYIKSELNKTQDLLYIPTEHEEISSFFNSELRRYIWPEVYTATSILFSETYEQKTLLINSSREYLYIPKNSQNKIIIPWGDFSIKNKFWDLTKCADALQKYDKAHGIESPYNE